MIDTLSFLVVRASKVIVCMHVRRVMRFFFFLASGNIKSVRELKGDALLDKTSLPTRSFEAL
jgi:hypothetical protein